MHQRTDHNEADALALLTWVAETRWLNMPVIVVGWKTYPFFTDSAFSELHQLSGGLPRRINLLCTRTPLAAWLAKSGRLQTLPRCF